MSGWFVKDEKRGCIYRKDGGKGIKAGAWQVTILGGGKRVRHTQQLSMHTHEVTIPIAGNFRKLTEFPGADLNRDTGDLSSKSAGTTSLGAPEAQQGPRALTLLGSHEVTARKSAISQTAALPAAEPETCPCGQSRYSGRGAAELADAAALSNGIRSAAS